MSVLALRASISASWKRFARSAARRPDAAARYAAFDPVVSGLGGPR